jgi:FkbM family methyltransferase
MPSLSDLLRRRLKADLPEVAVTANPVMGGRDVRCEAAEGVSSNAVAQDAGQMEPAVFPASPRLKMSLLALWESDDQAFLSRLGEAIGRQDLTQQDLRDVRYRLAQGEPRTSILSSLMSRGAVGVDDRARRELRIAGFFLRRRNARPRVFWDVINAIGRWHVSEILCARDDSAFVSRAYQAVLGRLADDSGRNHFLRALRVGSTRLEVLLALQGSAEGRAAGSRVAGLSTLAWFVEVARFPFIRQLIGIIRLPGFVFSVSRRLRLIEGALSSVGEGQVSVSRVVREETAAISKGLDTIRHLQEAASLQSSGRHDALRRELDELPVKLQELAGKMAGEVDLLRQAFDTVQMRYQNNIEALVAAHDDVVGKVSSLEEFTARVFAAVSKQNESLRATMAGLAGSQAAAAEELRNVVAKASGLEDLTERNFSSLSQQNEALRATMSLSAKEQVSAVGDLREGVGRLEVEIPALQLRVNQLDGRVGDLQSLAGAGFSELAPQIERVERYSLASASRFAIPCGEGSILVRSVDGYVLCPQDDFALVSSLVEGAPYEPGSSRILASCLRPGDVCVDIGANVGLHTLVAARAVGARGRVLAFEAHPQTAALLSRTVWMNGFADTVTVYPYAISDVEGSVQMHLGPTSGHHSLLPLGVGGGRGGDALCVNVDARRLDDVLPAGTTPAFVKVDVEGVELNVLKGGAETFRRCKDVGILVEFGYSHLQRGRVDPRDWFSQFSAFGFVWKAVDETSCSLIDLSLDQMVSQGSVNIFFARSGSPLWGRLEGL